MIYRGSSYIFRGRQIICGDANFSPTHVHNSQYAANFIAANTVITTHAQFLQAGMAGLHAGCTGTSLMPAYFLSESSRPVRIILFSALSASIIFPGIYT